MDDLCEVIYFTNRRIARGTFYDQGISAYAWFTTYIEHLNYYYSYRITMIVFSKLNNESYVTFTPNQWYSMEISYVS